MRFLCKQAAYSSNINAQGPIAGTSGVAEYKVKAAHTRLPSVGSRS